MDFFELLRFHVKETIGMAKHLRMKCSSCGNWNRVPVNKIFIKQNTIEPKVKVDVYLTDGNTKDFLNWQ